MSLLDDALDQLNDEVERPEEANALRLIAPVIRKALLDEYAAGVEEGQLSAARDISSLCEVLRSLIGELDKISIALREHPTMVSILADARAALAAAEGSS